MFDLDTQGVYNMRHILMFNKQTYVIYAQNNSFSFLFFLSIFVGNLYNLSDTWADRKNVKKNTSSGKFKIEI